MPRLVKLSGRTIFNHLDYSAGCTLCHTVIGYEMRQYQLAEQANPHQLAIKVLTPPGSLQSSVTLRVTAQSENATGE